MQTKIDEQRLTEALYYLLEERLPEGGISENALKREMRLKEVQWDIKNKLPGGEKFTSTDFIRFYGLFLLFVLERGGFVSFARKDVFEWQEFKSVFYRLTTDFDKVFDFKKGKGRPTEPETDFLKLSGQGVFCREHNMLICDHRDKYQCNYQSLLSDLLALRLAISKEWQERKARTERERIFEREFKVAKTAVERFWLKLYGQRPPMFSQEDKEFIKLSYSIADQYIIMNHLPKLFQPSDGFPE